MQLRDFLSYEEIYIQCHDSPDADALASGFGLYTYFRNHGIKTHLIYTGRFRIRKTNLVLMVEKLNIPVEYVEEGTLRLTDELLLTVDSQYGAGNITKIPAEHIGIIDHHQMEARNFPDSLILSDFGSCSTVVWKLLCEEQFDPNDYPDLATALYYGLYSDTQQFTEVHNPADKDMHDALKYRNSVFSLLKNSNISSSELEIAAIAKSRGQLVVPHGSSVYSHHAVITFTNTPFSEFLMTSPDCSTMRPQFDPILLNEPVPVNGRIHKSVLDKPGFGVELNRDCNLKRPYSH
mgnify:CR=1 FL=1